MRNKYLYIIAVVVLINGVAIGSCTGAEKKRTNYEICVDGINGEGSWSVFGTVTNPKADSAALSVCAQILSKEDRERWIDKYTAYKANCKDFTKREKLILQFLQDGVPTKAAW